jgi:tRNA A37 threonylcarbamoyladenosine biosynthesis protein TsaE
MRKSENLAVIGFEVLMGNPQNIILVEWPENAKGIIPRGAHRVEFRHGKKENERTIIIKS